MFSAPAGSGHVIVTHRACSCLQPARLDHLRSQLSVFYGKGTAVIPLYPPSCVRCLISSNALRRSTHIIYTLIHRVPPSYRNTSVSVRTQEMLAALSALPVDQSTVKGYRPKLVSGGAAGRTDVRSISNHRQRNAQHRIERSVRRESFSDGFHQTSSEDSPLGVTPFCARITTALARSS